MKIALKNPTKEDILDYPIEELHVGLDGEPVFDGNTQQYKKTGRTLKWSLKAGETAVFPKYVADYLQHVYGFLGVKNISEKYLRDDNVSPEDLNNAPELNENEVESIDRVATNNFQCRYCDAEPFKNSNGLGMHMAARHPEKL